MNLLEKYNLIGNEEFINSITEKELAILVDGLCKYWLENKTEIASSNSVGSANPIWYSFEYHIWKLGEELRDVLKKRKDLQKSNLIKDTILQILTNSKYGKGRQPFALLTGIFKFYVHESDIRILLQDEDVQGHVIDSLRKQRRKGFDNEMKEIMNGKKGWIRQEAKKYIDKSSFW